MWKGCRVQGTQSQLASVDGWLDFVRGLPADAAPGELMSHSALRATIVRILDMRTSDLLAARDPETAVEADSVFDSIAAYYRRQYAGDGDEIQVTPGLDVLRDSAQQCCGNAQAWPGDAVVPTVFGREALHMLQHQRTRPWQKEGIATVCFTSHVLMGT